MPPLNVVIFRPPRCHLKQTFHHVLDGTYCEICGNTLALAFLQFHPISQKLLESQTWLYSFLNLPTFVRQGASSSACRVPLIRPFCSPSWGNRPTFDVTSRRVRPWRGWRWEALEPPCRSREASLPWHCDLAKKEAKRQLEVSWYDWPCDKTWKITGSVWWSLT